MQDERIIPFSKMTSEALYQCFTFAVNKIEEKQASGFSHELFELQQILVTCQLSSESVYILIANGKVWDAEIISRSILEASIKLLYLCTGSKDEKHEKYLEFFKKLPDIDSIKRTKKTEEILGLIGKKDDEDFIYIKEQILDPEKLELLRQQYPKKDQDEIERKWSFNKVIQSIKESDPEKYKELPGLGFTYLNHSNLVHMDATAIGQIQERNTRKEEDRTSTYYCHSIRALQDLIILALLRNEAILNHIGITYSTPKAVTEIQKIVHDEYIIANKLFMEEQKLTP